MDGITDWQRKTAAGIARIGPHLGKVRAAFNAAGVTRATEVRVLGADPRFAANDAPDTNTRPLTAPMLRELRCIHRTGEVGDLLDYGYGSLAFYAREKTLTALLTRGLIVDEPGGYVLTGAGLAAIAPSQPERA